MYKLNDCNETELIQLGRSQGVGIIKRGLPKDVLVALVNGDQVVRDEHLSQINFTRKVLEDYINAPSRINIIMSQLPGCTGKCVSYQCSSGRHGLCFIPSESLVR